MNQRFAALKAWINIKKMILDRRYQHSLLLFFILTVLCQQLAGQMAGQTNRDSLLAVPTLANVVQYAIARQPQIQQALIDKEITNLEVKSRLSEWYPQVNFNYFYTRNTQLQSTVIGGNTVVFGVENNSGLQFSATQEIFNRDVLFASKTKNDVRLQAQQLSDETKINAIAEVTRAFYDVVTTIEAGKVASKNIIRQERSLKDSRAKYDAGVVDKTDYKRATIALNNSIAQKKTNQESSKSKTEYLKSIINYPINAPLHVIYDSATLEQEIYIDTLQTIDFNKRIEYQILSVQRKLQEANVKYNKWSYIPSVSANGAYNLNYQNNSFSKLYSQSFPNSFVTLSLAFPIFQGGKRRYDVKQAEWQLKRTDLDIINLKNSLNAEYAAALSGYKASLVFFLAGKENVQLAQEVYDVIELQYQSGIKTYLEVAVAESDLRTAQITYFTALFQVLSRKIDVQRSLGLINY